MRNVRFHDRTSNLYHSVIFSVILKLVHTFPQAKSDSLELLVNSHDAFKAKESDLVL
jgi:hypothetical protein